MTNETTEKTAGIETAENTSAEKAPAQAETVTSASNDKSALPIVDRLGVQFDPELFRDQKLGRDGRFRPKIGKPYPWPEGAKPEKQSKKQKTISPGIEPDIKKNSVVRVSSSDQKEKRLSKEEFEKKCREAAEDYQMTIEGIGELLTETAGKMTDKERDAFERIGARAAARRNGELPAVSAKLALGLQTSKYLKRIITCEEAEAETTRLFSILKRVYSVFADFFDRWMPPKKVV